MKKDFDLKDFIINFAKEQGTEIILKGHHHCGGLLMTVNGVYYCGYCGYLGNLK